jgi:Leucine-rich repeat (LRR) protein
VKLDKIVQAPIDELVMNDCRLDLETLTNIFNHFPCLESLFIMKNDLSEVPSISKDVRLKRLFIGDNPIYDFTKLWHLSTLKKFALRDYSSNHLLILVWKFLI